MDDFKVVRVFEPNENVMIVGNLVDAPGVAYYCFDTRDIELNIVWPGWVLLSNEEAEQVVTEALIHEELHHWIHLALYHEIALFSDEDWEGWDDHMAVNGVMEHIGCKLSPDSEKIKELWQRSCFDTDLFIPELVKIMKDQLSG